MKFLILISFIIPYICFAEQSQYERVKSKCTEHIDWSKVSCKFTNKDQGYSKGGCLIGKITNTVFSGIGEILQLAYDNPTMPTIPSLGTVKRNSIIGLISNYLDENTVSTCQKICLIKCVSSQLIKYKENLYSKFGSVKTAYNCEEGVCTEFSKLFDDLAFQFDIPSRMVSSHSMAHTFNKVKLNDEWVYLEPQHSSCEFYTDDPEYFNNYN